MPARQKLAHRKGRSLAVRVHDGAAVRIVIGAGLLGRVRGAGTAVRVHRGAAVGLGSPEGSDELAGPIPEDRESGTAFTPSTEHQCQDESCKTLCAKQGSTFPGAAPVSTSLRDGGTAPYLKGAKARRPGTAAPRPKARLRRLGKRHRRQGDDSEGRNSGSRALVRNLDLAADNSSGGYSHEMTVPQRGVFGNSAALIGLTAASPCSAEPFPPRQLGPSLRFGPKLPPPRRDFPSRWSGSSLFPDEQALGVWACTYVMVRACSMRYICRLQKGSINEDDCSRLHSARLG